MKVMDAPLIEQQIEMLEFREVLGSRFRRESKARRHAPAQILREVVALLDVGDDLRNRLRPMRGDRILIEHYGLGNAARLSRNQPVPPIQVEAQDFGGMFIRQSRPHGRVGSVVREVGKHAVGDRVDEGHGRLIHSIKAIIIRKKHWGRKKQWDSGFGFRTRRLKGGDSAGIAGREPKPMSADRVAVPNS
jgi:hypothetical protein